MMTRTMIDLKSHLKHLYAQNAAARHPHIADVPPLNFLMLDGVGDPNTESFYEAVGSLNSAAYTLKFTFKKERGINFPVMPTEGLWWTANDEAFRLDYKANWVWTIMILMPDVVTADDVTEAITKAQTKKPVPTLDLIRLGTFHEGLSAQILHIGPYDEAEIPTVERLQRFIIEQGYVESGKHHEIYLSDPRRTAPEKLKTIIRHPITRA
jgi:hypothetical protein